MHAIDWSKYDQPTLKALRYVILIHTCGGTTGQLITQLAMLPGIKPIPSHIVRQISAFMKKPGAMPYAVKLLFEKAATTGAVPAIPDASVIAHTIINELIEFKTKDVPFLCSTTPTFDPMVSEAL